MKALLAIALLLVSGSARASEITGFVSKASPDAVWAAGFGGAFSISFFSIVHFEGELARQSGELPDHAMYSLTGSALLAPPTGRIVPYAGLGVGVFRQEAGTLSDHGTHSALILGLKVKLGPIFVVKGEYRRLSLSGEPLLEFNNRFSVGAGLSF